MHLNKIASAIYSIANVVHKSSEYNSEWKMHSKCHFNRALFHITIFCVCTRRNEMIYAKRTQNKKFPFAECSSHDSHSQIFICFFLHLFKCVQYAFTHVGITTLFLTHLVIIGKTHVLHGGNTLTTVKNKSEEEINGLKKKKKKKN